MGSEFQKGERVHVVLEDGNTTEGIITKVIKHVPYLSHGGKCEIYYEFMTPDGMTLTNMWNKIRLEKINYDLPDLTVAKTGSPGIPEQVLRQAGMFIGPEKAKKIVSVDDGDVSEIKLLLCPFCGSGRQGVIIAENRVTVSCENCHASVQGSTVTTTANRWNKRIPVKEPAKDKYYWQLGKLKTELRALLDDADDD